jgi:AraC-like DNA-binding protein
MRLMSALITRDNAKVLLMQNDAMERQANYLDRLHARADNYLHELDGQRVINWLALGIIILLLIVIVLFYLYYLRKITLQRERVVSTLWNMEAKEAEPQATSSIMPADEGTNPTMEDDLTEKEVEEAATMQGDGTSMFITRFREVVEARLEDSDLSVDDLAANMSLSRVQLYRKVKAVTGSSPVELLRTARLARAYQLLLTSDKTVSEVAYAVGFTAPSYFTKCFKEEYGMVPGNVRKTEE